MAKINASLADVKDDFLIEPGTYQFEVVDAPGYKFDGTPEDEDPDQYRIKSKIVGIVEGLDESALGRTFVDFVDVKMRTDGTPSQYGLIQLKRYATAILGEENIRGREVDTDELKGHRFIGQLYHDSYTPKGSTEQKTNNKLKAIVPA